MMMLPDGLVTEQHRTQVTLGARDVSQSQYSEAQGGRGPSSGADFTEEGGGGGGGRPAGAFLPRIAVFVAAVAREQFFPWAAKTPLRNRGQPDRQYARLAAPTEDEAARREF